MSRAPGSVMHHGTGGSKAVIIERVCDRIAAMRSGRVRLNELVAWVGRRVLTITVVGVAACGLAATAGVAQEVADQSALQSICREKMAGSNTVRGVTAVYKNQSRTRLDVRANVTRFVSDCDTDGPTRLDPSGSGDIGDRVFVVFRQIKPRESSWRASSKPVRLTNRYVVGTTTKPDGTRVLGHGIDQMVETASCKKGTKYRGAVKVVWTPDDGARVTRTFTGRTQTC